MSKDHYVHDTGKGSRQRSVNKEEFDKNWDAIFKKKPDSLDAAYERKALTEGLIENPLFEENKFKKCPYCKTINSYDSEFCGSCGTRLTQGEMF